MPIVAAIFAFASVTSLTILSAKAGTFRQGSS